MLECSDGTYYTGYTKDLEGRVKEHKDTKRGVKYLRGRLPVNVGWSKGYRYKSYAMKAEYKIKQLSHRQKELLISGMRLDKVMGRKHGETKQ